MKAGVGSSMARSAGAIEFLRLTIAIGSQVEI